MATLDNDDIKQIENVVNEIIRKNRISEHIRDGKKEQKERLFRRIRFPKEYGLALFSAGLPLLFAGLVLIIYRNHINSDGAFIIGGSAVSLFGYLFMVFGKWLAKM
jgi:hypothetical protein